MISSQQWHYQPELDQLILPNDPDFAVSGLRVPSVIRVARLAVVATDVFSGRLGMIAPDRLRRIRQSLATWLLTD